MKRYLLLVMAVLMAITLPAQETQTKTKVAIYTTGDVDTNYKKVIGSKVTSVITQSNEYAAVERTADFLNALSQELDYQTSGAVSDNQIVKIGQQFGVRYVIVLDISDLFGSIFISARMIDVRTGLIKKSVEYGKEIESMNELLSLSQFIAYGIIDPEREYKCVGPFNSEKDLYYFIESKIPNGFRALNFSEYELFQRTFAIKGHEPNYPIFCNVINEMTYPLGYSSDYRQYFTNGTIVNKDESINQFRFWHASSGQGSSSYNEYISGYIYLVKE